MAEPGRESKRVGDGKASRTASGATGLVGVRAARKGASARVARGAGACGAGRRALESMADLGVPRSGHGRMPGGTAVRVMEDVMPHARCSSWIRYVVAVATVACSLLLQRFLMPVLPDQSPYTILLLAPMVSAWFGGLR